MPKALFQEENVYVNGDNGSFTMNIYYDRHINKKSNEFIAFTYALEDLKAGHLAIGGGSGHGLGFIEMTQNKGEKWLWKKEMSNF